MKSIFITKPPPLKPPVIDTTKLEEPNISRPTYVEVMPISNNFKLPLIIIGSLVILGIIGWLIFQNGNQESIIEEVKEKINTRIDLGPQSSFKPSDIYFTDDESKVCIYFVDSKRQAACLVEYSLADGKTTLT